MSRRLQWRPRIMLHVSRIGAAVMWWDTLGPHQLKGAFSIERRAELLLIGANA